MKRILLIMYLSGVTLFAQNSNDITQVDKSQTDKLSIPTEESTIEVKINNRLENEDLQTLFDFENINQSEFTFTGESIKDKFYVVRVKEFLNGELINTKILFDERGTEFFRIDTTETSFKLLTKVDKDEIKVWLKGDRFGSKRAYFPTFDSNGVYVAKDFYGWETVLKENSEEPFHLMSVITPNRSEDGSASYCKVAQSDIDPEEFGKEFNIPHYFLIEIEFTK